MHTDGENLPTITFTVRDGARIRIKGLGRGDYIIKESGNDNYTLTARTGSIVGGLTSNIAVADNNTISLTLDAETRLDLTNSPKAICKIGEQNFYTLRSMVEYVDTVIASKSATVEMLTDYVMPAEDTVEIPHGFDLIIKTEENLTNPVVITRTAGLADVPLFTNSGALTFNHIDLDGSSVASTAPFIQSAGDLTIGESTTILNAAGGGAIRATAGNITVKGTIYGCSAEDGGAIYYTGNGTISLSEYGTLENNTATGGNGGAIYMTGGTLALSGNAALTENRAENGKGGAVYAESILLTADQSAELKKNTAAQGGAVYVETGTITIAKTEDYDGVPPAITGNKATTGNGGAIWLGTGSITVSGGSLANNEAETGSGGAIYADGAAVNISDSAELKNNTAEISGGAVYAETGAVTVSGGSLENNEAKGSGGAVYASSGTVTLSGPVSLKTNKAAESGKGGAVYAASIDATLNQAAEITGNEAGSGGAMYAYGGTILLAPSTVGEDKVAPTVTGNKAKAGNGGAIWLGTGSITVSGGSLADNEAKGSGGAIYASSASFTLSSAEGYAAPTVQGNKADSSGGAVYSANGAVTISAGTIGGLDDGLGNSAGENGGVLYAGSGAVTLGAVTMTGNTARGTYDDVNDTYEAGLGGAVYIGSGTAELTGTTMTGNSANNGAAVFVQTGRASFSAGSYTGNTTVNGGAVGMGSTDARLTFSGNVLIKDNKQGKEENSPKSNVYLDQDSSDVLNFAGLGTGASIGIFVPDALTEARDVPGARFGSYTNNANAAKITNDRYAALTEQIDTSAKKLYWGNAIKVSVCYISSFSGGFPPSSDPNSIRYYNTDSYYPELNDAAISELAAELFTKKGSEYKLNNAAMSSTAVYAGAYLDGDSAFGDYLTDLTWDTVNSQWYVTRRDGSTTPLPHTNGQHRIYIYYAEPAYISIENNTKMGLTISDMTVYDQPVINNSTVAGYGMVFAKNGAIGSALLPVTAEDLQLDAGDSINLLIPGGQGMTYTLDGRFTATEGGSVRLRRTGETEETTLSYNEDGSFAQLTGTTLPGAGTYTIIFGDDKVICKVVDANDEEHPYSRISDAIAAIKNGTITLAVEKTATIEMVTDYLLTTSDVVDIPQGYDITITTAPKRGAEGTEGLRYFYSGTGDRAIISRDSENKQSMITAWKALASNQVVTTLRLKNLIIDGKSVRGNSDGGAVATQYTNVYIENVEFKNVYASNGGALLVMFHFNKTKTQETKHTVSGTILRVTGSNFIGCTSTTTVTSNRLGGGAIVTNAETMELDGCDFRNCTAVDQAGAVFHRIDFDDESYTIVKNCSFSNCSARAAGGLELDSKTINVSDTLFEHCVATERNGGGFNVWPLNSGTPSANCWVTVTGCTFNDCQVTDTKSNGGNGGGFRCAAVYTKVVNCTFTNNKGYYGGGFCVSNTNAKKAEIYGCTFEHNTANQGGGVLLKAKEVIIGDGYYYLDADGKAVTVKKDGSVYKYSDDNPITDENILSAIQTRHTEVNYCTSNNESGGGISHDKDVSGSSLSITNAVIHGNEVKAGSKDGGGVFTNAHTVVITGGTISNNRTTRYGGGLYSNAAVSLTITGTTISGNASANSDGGGVYYAPASDNKPLTVNSCTIENNTAANGNGGGIYTTAGPITIGKADGVENGTVIQSCTAKNGGGLYQDKNTANASLTLTDATVSSCRATSGGGGGIRTNAWKVTLNGATVKNNTSTGNGGGLWCTNTSSTESLAVNGSTIDGNTSGSYGGGIYAEIKTVTVNSPYTVTVGTETVNKAVSISGNTASNGGGIYHNRNSEGSALTVTGTEAYPVRISGNQTSSNGGGVYANVRSTGFTWAEISGNRANSNGGGIYDPMDSADYSLTLDHTTVSGNTSGNQGGGVYTKTKLYLKNDSMVTGNRLTGSTVGNAAGVYLLDNRTLYVGSEGATVPDNSSVRDNSTASGAASNLRLWWNGTTKENAVGSVYVYCALKGYIGVVNAAKVGTQFGTSAIKNPVGFTDDYSVFKADTSTLHGIIDRTDENGTKIIWAGPPVAKITDGEGNLLYLKQDTDGSGNLVGTSPAIFDRLYEGSEGVESIVGAFNVLNSANLGLDPVTPGFDSSKPMLYNANGTPYKGTEFCVKMLVETYTSDSRIYVKGVEGRTVTLTTAGTGDAEYPSEAKRATIIAGVSGNGLLNPKGNLVLKDIVLDGGSKARVMFFEPTVDSTVTLGKDAVIQNGKVDNGGGVYIRNGSSGTSPAKFTIAGGVIRNCTSTSTSNGGGAIYIDSGTFNFVAGNITDCTAANFGGGVFQNTGTFNMSGGTISGCSAKKGGGILVPNNASAPFNMSGGSIVNNTATQTGGGIAVNGMDSRIYFSGKVTVSGNKATKSGKQVACNVELNQDSNLVINTNNGGLSGGSYIGVYVPDGTTLYNKHGGERMPFGTFAEGDNTTNLYSFVNDRNGFKGGIIENPAPNTIYWIKIFSLEVSKTVVSGSCTSVNPDELFLFKVNVRGTPTVNGQLSPAQIDSSTGSYGGMTFTSNGTDTTTAVFALKNGESVTGVNLSEGLDYEIIEYLIVSGGAYENQHIRYAALPMNGYSGATESLEYDGTIYTVIKANSYSSKIGENKNRTDVDPYTSAVPFTNLMPVCKITDNSGNLLYRRYTWKKTTNKPGEQEEYYYAPAVYTELTGENGALKALEGTFYSANSGNPSSYSVDNGVKLQMLIGTYLQTTAITLPAAVTGNITLTTAGKSDTLFPKQDSGTTSTIKRSGFTESMFTVGGSGKLTLDRIFLDGDKSTHTADADGGIVYVSSGGKLTIQAATLQNSKTSQKGGAVYVAGGGTLTMTGGTVNKNESTGNGAGIYLAQGSTMYLSGTPSFGGSGVQINSIATDSGNIKNETLNQQKNGSKTYRKPRQDIYLEESTGDPASLVLAGNLNVAGGSIWVWADNQSRYGMSNAFAKVEITGSITEQTYLAFRNAQTDEHTFVSDTNYLTGDHLREKDGFIHWTGGMDVAFKKVDGFGNPLGGAVFTLYTNSNCRSQDEYKRNNAAVTATSSAETADKGMARFDKLPVGEYYMKETGNPDSGHYADNTNVYRVLVGKSRVEAVGKTGEYLVQLMSGSVAVDVPDIAAYGIVNEASDRRKVILKKIDNSTKDPLSGAVFSILRYDRTVLYSDQTSGAGGAFWLGSLPYGLYYLHETTVPSGYTAQTGGNWFSFEVNADGVSALTELSAAP